MIGRSNTAQRFLPLSAAATSDNGGRLASDNWQRSRRPAEEAHVLLLSFPAGSVSGWTGVAGGGGGAVFPRPSPRLPLPHQAVTSALCPLPGYGPRPGGHGHVSHHRRARASRGGRSWPSLPEGSGLNNSLGRGRKSRKLVNSE